MKIILLTIVLFLTSSFAVFMAGRNYEQCMQRHKEQSVTDQADFQRQVNDCLREDTLAKEWMKLQYKMLDYGVQMRGYNFYPFYPYQVYIAAGLYKDSVCKARHKVEIDGIELITDGNNYLSHKDSVYKSKEARRKLVESGIVRSDWPADIQHDAWEYMRKHYR